MLAGALFLTACSHNSSLPPFTASGFAEDQGAVRIWRKDSGDNVHLLAVFSPWRSGDTTTREYRWQGDNLTLININVYSKPPVNIRARFDDRGDLSFMQRESDGEKQQLSNDQIDLYRYRADQIRQISDALRQGRVVLRQTQASCSPLSISGASAPGSLESGSNLPQSRFFATPIVGTSTIKPKWLATPRRRGCEIP